VFTAIRIPFFWVFKIECSSGEATPEAPQTNHQNQRQKLQVHNPPYLKQTEEKQIGVK